MFHEPHDRLHGPFADRGHAGRALAERLTEYRGRRPLVVGLPRGGVAVAAEVARSLGADLDIAIVRKIGAPGNPELALGAAGEGNVVVRNAELLSALQLSEADFRTRADTAAQEVRDRARLLRADRPLVSVRGRVVIVVDDGLATGATAQAAVEIMRAHDAAEVIVAVPVGAPETIARLDAVADRVVCVDAPTSLGAVGAWYRHFDPVSDDEVVRILRSFAGDPARVEEHEVVIRDDHHLLLPGTLREPADALGIVVFAHGSGSSRMSPRNRLVADRLNAGGFATLLFDLLTADEERDRANVFDLELLTHRLLTAVVWLDEQAVLGAKPLGFFGASTGAGAALWAAAELQDRVAAVVSRGGRPDLVIDRLPDVTAATLLIVGGHDDRVLEWNRDALAVLAAPKELAIVPGATHLFEEPGALEQVAELASDWFVRSCATTGTVA
jgi:putative phosphoribosyl transferase